MKHCRVCDIRLSGTEHACVMRFKQTHTLGKLTDLCYSCWEIVDKAIDTITENYLREIARIP